MSFIRIAAVAAALMAMAAVPAAAGAATVPMRGVVSGSPYGASNGQMAVPVLFSKMTVSNAGLKSPVGVIVMPRAQKVKLPDGAGSTLPVNLRTGDRFKGSGTIGSLQRRVFYPRVVFKKSAVYFRSKELSLAELSAAVAALRSALGDLQAQLLALKGASLKALQDLYAQLADLRNQLAALKALGVPDFQAQIDALNQRLNDLIAGLPDFSKFALLTQLPDLTGYAKLTDLTGFLKAADVTAMINAAIAGLAPQSALDTANATIATLQTKLNTVCGAVKNATVTLPAPLSTTVPINVNTGGVC